MVGGVCACTRRACNPAPTPVRRVRGACAAPLQPLQGRPLLVSSDFCTLIHI